MNIRILFTIIFLGFSGVLYANDSPKSPMYSMSDNELGAVNDHNDSKENANEHFTHEHEVQNSLIKIFL